MEKKLDLHDAPSMRLEGRLHSVIGDLGIVSSGAMVDVVWKTRCSGVAKIQSDHNLLLLATKFLGLLTEKISLRAFGCIFVSSCPMGCVVSLVGEMVW